MTAVFPARQPSRFLAGYYDKLAQLFRLGVVDLNLGLPDPALATGRHIDEYYNDPALREERGVRASKLSGAVAAEYFRQEIQRVLERHPEYGCKVSENNVYIQGSHIEFDLLILRENARKLCGAPVYRREDVVAVLECKANGVYTEYNDEKRYRFDAFELDKFTSAYLEDLQGCEHNIKLGYMTMNENRPLRDNGKSDFIRGTLMYMDDKFRSSHRSAENKWFYFMARCHYSCRKPDTYMTDEQWEQFVLDLVRS